VVARSIVKRSFVSGGGIIELEVIMSVAQPTSPPGGSGPAWEIARLFPDQGFWSEGDYLSLTRDARFLVELVDGYIEVLPMPSLSHQRIVRFLVALLQGFLSRSPLGELLFAPIRMRLWGSRIREPDIMFLLNEHADRATEDFCEGADLVIEVVSADPKDRKRDLETKRAEYARAGIGEYWIVDPEEGRISVLKLEGNQYGVHSEGRGGERVRSHMLAGLEVDVAAVLASASSRR